MNGIDLLILLFIVIAATRGVQIGLLRQLFSFVGFLIGLFVGSWLAPFVTQILPGSPSRLLITILLTLGLAIFLSTMGEHLAVRLKGIWAHIKLTHTVDKGLGVAFSVLAVLIASWLFASALNRLPLANLGVYIDESRIISAVDKVMPPAPPVIERLGRLISPQGFPEVFVGQDPSSEPTGPPVAEEVSEAAAAARRSTVKIEGYSCGGVSTGSGFVAHTDYVVTNAHVVAGVRSPVVLDENGRHRATVVWFDPQLDFAVLRTTDLAGPPLPLATERVERGKSAAVLGYPGGGDLEADGATILNSHRAIGRNIYGRGLTHRDVYELYTQIEQGNSGGPVVLPNGNVAGVVFGVSVENDNYGYALTSVEIADELSQAITRRTAVSTGPCVL